MTTKLERELATSVAYLERAKMNERALAVVSGQELARAEPGELRFTPEQEKMIRETYAYGANESEFMVLMETAKARRLNPLLKQVYFVKRWDSVKRREVWAVQVSIDGMRAIADRTTLYDGQDEAEFTYEGDVMPATAKVRIYRKGIARPFVGVARWSECVQTTKEGKVTHFWRQMGHTMLAKCAEANGMRKAFPEDTGGIYVPEEMMQAENGSAQLERRTPDISPHGVDSDLSEQEISELVDPQELMDMLVKAERLLEAGSWSAARSIIGMKGGSPGDFGPAFSVVKNAGKLSAAYSKDLGKLWGNLDRRIAKLEKADLEKPADVLDSLKDDADDFPRE